MSHSLHLARRGRALVFRRRVPAAARKSFRSAFLCFSLETHLLAEGRRRAARATRFTDAAFAVLEACGGTMLDETTVQTVTVTLVDRRGIRTHLRGDRRPIGTPLALGSTVLPS